MTRRRLKRAAAWLGALLAGLLLAAVVMGTIVAVIGEGEDGIGTFTGAAFGFLAFGTSGLVAAWLFARPAPWASRLLTFGVPIIALGVLGALRLSAGPVLVLALPLTWPLALVFALHPPSGGQSPDAA